MPTFEDILQQHRIPHISGGEHHHARHGWLNLDCPWCGSVGKWHLGYNLSWGYMNCWVCGRHSAREFLVTVLGVSWGRAAELTKDLERASEPPVSPLRASKPKPPPNRRPLLSAHRRYLVDRGFDPDELARLWGIEGIGLSARLQWRIYIPIHWRGHLVSWTTRSIAKDHPKRYVSASPEEESMDRNRILYGMDYVRDVVVAVEGPTDVWKIGPGAVAALGLTWSEAQIGLLMQYPTRVLAFDSTPDAQKRARRIARQLKGCPGETIQVEFETGDDPASVDNRELEEFRKQFLE